MKMVSMQFALVSDRSRSFGGELHESAYARPYAKREQVTINAEIDDSLASLRDRAFRAFRINAPDASYPHGPAAYGRLAFFKDGDERGFVERATPRLFWGQLVLVDEAGLAVFGVQDHRSVTVGDLLRASEAGVLDGDPLRPYLIVEGGWGDQPPPDWPTIIHGFEVTWSYLERLLIAGGYGLTVREVWRFVRDKVKRGSEVANEHREWAQHRYSPYQFQALLRTRDWSTDQVAVLLGCTPEEAEAILWCLGFTFDAETETWSEASDEASELIQAIHLEIAISSDQHPDIDRDEILRERIRYLIEHGTSAPVPWATGQAETDSYVARPRFELLRKRAGFFLDRIRDLR